MLCINYKFVLSKNNNLCYKSIKMINLIIIYNWLVNDITTYPCLHVTDVKQNLSKQFPLNSSQMCITRRMTDVMK
jgi:hypothetical protein